VLLLRKRHYPLEWRLPCPLRPPPVPVQADEPWGECQHPWVRRVRGLLRQGTEVQGDEQEWVAGWGGGVQEGGAFVRQEGGQVCSADGGSRVRCWQAADSATAPGLDG